jgi:hypothetical protein
LKLILPWWPGSWEEVAVGGLKIKNHLFGHFIRFIQFEPIFKKSLKLGIYRIKNIPKAKRRRRATDNCCRSCGGRGGATASSKSTQQTADGACSPAAKSSSDSTAKAKCMPETPMGTTSSGCSRSASASGNGRSWQTAACASKQRWESKCWNWENIFFYYFKTTTIMHQKN